MEFKKQGLVKRFKDFISSINKKDKVAVLHHTDPDGVCSGVIISKLIEKTRNKKIDLRINQKGNIHNITKETFDKLKKNKINIIIITDLSADEHLKDIKKLLKFAKVLIIDHHPVYNNIKLKNIVMIKSSLVSDIPSAKYCAAKLCYDLGNLVADLSDLDWIAAVGSIGDIATEPFKSWLNKVFKKYKISMKKDLFKTKLGKVAVIFSSAEAVSHKNVGLCFKILYRAKNYSEVLNSSIKKFQKKIDDELKYYIKNLNSLAFVYPKINLIFYDVNSKNNIKSQLCTLLGIKYPNKTIICVSFEKDLASVSARRGDSNVSVNKLLQSAVKGFCNANAGGHIPAAGACFPKKYYKKFKKRVINLLKKE